MNIVEEFEHPPLALGRRFPVARRGDGRVLSNGEPESEPRLHQGQTRTEGHRQAEREGLDGPACDDLAVQRYGRQATRNRLGGDAERRQHAARRRLGRAEDVGAKVEPVVAPTLRRIRPPSRSRIQEETSRSRNDHAAASPAIPPPTTTTSQVAIRFTRLRPGLGTVRGLCFFWIHIVSLYKKLRPDLSEIRRFVACSC